MAKILLIDDDQDFLVIMDRLLRTSGHQTIIVSNPEKLIPSSKKHQPDLIISDIMMPGITGAVVYGTIREQLGADTPIIISSGTSLKVGVQSDPLLSHCPKPVNHKKLLSLIEELLLKRDNILSDKKD